MVSDHNEIVEIPQENITIIKSTHKANLFSKLRDKLPQSSKKLLILLLIVLAIPVTVGLALIQQETRSNANEGDRKIFLGMATDVSQRLLNQAPEEEKLAMLQQDLEKIKAETGSYPAVYHFFTELGGETKIPSLEILNYLDSKGITPMISLAPLGADARRKDGRFIFSTNTTPINTASAGQLRFNTSNPSQITKIYVSKTASGTETPTLLASTWVPGAKISIFGTTYYEEDGKEKERIAYINPNYFDFTVNSNTDKGSYWEIGVTQTKAGTLNGIFSDTKPVFITMADTFGKNWGNSKIANGSKDDKFNEFANRAKEFNKPIILRYAWEMDGTWFPWSAGKRESTNGNYLRYTYFDMGNTTANYVSAWKHVYGLVKPIAPNVKFNWCSGGSPIAAYFPGDEFVDYVGFDTYSGIGGSQHNSLINLSDGPIDALKNLSNKKIIIGETGINTAKKQKTESEFPTYRKNWLSKGYPALYNYSPRVAGIVYFNLDVREFEKGNNWLMSDEPDISSSYKALLLDPRFQGKFESQNILPTNNPTPTPEPNSTLPFGNHDEASCSVVTGWACDENNYNKSVSVKLYDGPKSEGKMLGTVTADKARESEVANECGGVKNHGFSFNTPDNIKDGSSHRIYAYAVDDQNPDTSRLYASPKDLSCDGGSTPTPTPPDPTGCIRKLPTVSYGDTNKSGKRNETVTYKITIKNNDINCNGRSIEFDLKTPTARWSYSPETVKLSSNETKTINLKVTSGPYSSYGAKSLPLTLKGVYKPHTLFSTQTLEYKVIE